MSNKRLFFILGTILAVGGGGVASAPVNAFAQVGASGAATVTVLNPNAAVASSVQTYFSDIPVMIAIATCESGPRQFAANGAPLYAGANDEMVGVFQIDSAIHTAPALALGFDLTTLAGNMAYARYLYGEEGTEPWVSSLPCWSYATTAATIVTPSSTSTPALTLNLSLGEIDPQVLILQQLLNQTGFTLATSGPGSLGNETTKFGALTYAALRNFQCTEGIACSGDEASTGYGLLNAPTRAALLALAKIPGGNATSSPEAAPTPVAIPVSTQNDPAEISELQSRINALVVIVQQLEAQIAAR